MKYSAVNVFNIKISNIQCSDWRDSKHAAETKRTGKRR